MFEESKKRLAVNFINIYARIFRTKFWRQSQNVIRKAAEKDVHTKKAREKTLMKLTPYLPSHESGGKLFY
jgi:hypothetical protein